MKLNALPATRDAESDRSDITCSCVCVRACWFVPPQCGFSLSLFCNYLQLRIAS